MRTTILTLSLLLCLGVSVYTYPGRYELARQQDNEVNLLAQILEAELQSEEEYEEGAIQEEEAMVEGRLGRWWKKIRKLIEELLEDVIQRRRDICQKIVGTDRQIYTPDGGCDNGKCLSCDAICAASQEGGLTWECETGYYQGIKFLKTKSKKISCSSAKNNKTFCCCAESNKNLLFRF